MSKDPAAYNVLVVDDSEETVELIKRNLEGVGYHVYPAHDVQDGLAFLESVAIDLVITDLKMPGQNGIQLIRHVAENYRGVGVLVITGFPSIEGAVESIKIGAEEYLVKPFTDEELFRSVQRVVAKSRPRKRRESARMSPRNFGITGESEAMLRVFKTIEKVMATNATVLISGESGTGKELVARAVHYGGKGSKAPFVPVNCGGIPDSLLESELFGHTRGAFTGATETRAGFFETAEGGTIFLDEISNTSLAMQAKLLRVLQDKEYYMVGSKKARQANVRVIAATNVDLMQLVRKGLFREDLYYRLYIVCIDLPPLRERGNDVDLLIEFFKARYTGELDRGDIRITPRALTALKSYSWPGNVRELQNLMHRLVILADDNTIDVPDLPEAFRYSASRSKGLNRTLEEVEAEYIQTVLAANGNNISRTAGILDIDRKTLREKLKRITRIDKDRSQAL